MGAAMPRAVEHEPPFSDASLIQYSHNQHNPMHTDNLTIMNFMKSHPLVTLATKDAGGALHLAHVFVYVDEDCSLYFVSRPDHRKAENIFINPGVSILFSDQVTVEQIQYTGTAAAIDDTEDVWKPMTELHKVVSKQKTNYWVPPVSQIDGDGYVMFKVTPDKITYRKYEDSETSDDMAERITDFVH